MRLIDNISTLLGDDMKIVIRPNSKLRIAASCFSIYAYEALKVELSRIDSLEFIFTAPTFTQHGLADTLPKKRREFFIPKADRERGLYGTDFEIQLRNKLTQRAIARECAQWIRKKARFRSNKTQISMQQFACVQNEQNNAVYMPLSGFTAVDLGYQRGNAISNIVHCIEDAASTSKYLQLFDLLWNDKEKLDDVTQAVCEHIDSVYQENSPEKVYFFMLYNIFNEFLENIDEDMLPKERTGYQNTLVWNKLFNYQRDAAIGIINKLDTYNGCILADSVGLGKTFTALAVIKYYELRNRSVLVLCPKKLAENWTNYNSNLTTNIFAKDRFNYDVFCHTDLSRTSGESFGIALNKVNWGNYDLVVIDESHNFRNNEAFKDRETRYQKLMNKVIRDGVKTKVLMLSATPVNNRFSDLKNQLALAYEGDSKLIKEQLGTTLSIEEIFRRAQAAFNAWSKLPPAQRTAQAILTSLDFDFFQLLDSVTIARSRKHIQTFYDTKDIGPFPERNKPLSFQCRLCDDPDVPDFNGIYRELSRLKLALYAPVSYILPSRAAKYEEQYDTLVEDGKGKLRQVDRERSLQALMTTNLLKRLESSVASFRLTLEHLEDKLNSTLRVINDYQNGGKLTLPDMQDVLFDDDDAEDAPLVGGKVQISLADMDVDSWRYDLEHDSKVIKSLLAAIANVTPEHDTKLQHLAQQVFDKIDCPINPGNKKIIVFTAFADTADYLYKHLSPALLKEKGLHTAKVTGQTSPVCTLGKGYSFMELLTLLAPRAKERHLAMPDVTGEIDLLIATDCISEGQNLQDCDYLINYDIHWNPVRIIQRFGRIDRIGSINKTIQLANYWPDITLDEYINLKERVENRMVIADATATGDDNMLATQSNEAAYRHEQLRRLKDEVIELEDVRTGVSITDLGLNDFRMDLLQYIKEHGDVASLPKGLHAVIPKNREIGLSPGCIFVLRNRNHAVNIHQQNRLHPYYLVYISESGKILASHIEPKNILDCMRSACRGKSEPILDMCQQFNTHTQEGRNMKEYSRLLGLCIQSIVQIKEEKDLDSLFSGGKTTALQDTIKGLDDFELITFLVVMNAGQNQGAD